MERLLHENPYPDLRIRTVLKWALAGALALVAVVSTAGFIFAVADPEETCRDELPYFEGLVIVESERAWPPPIVRCVAVDSDPGSDPDPYSFTVVAVTEVVWVILADLAALIAGATVVGWAIHTRRKRPAGSVGGTDG